jgi:hypothetical protein
MICVPYMIAVAPIAIAVDIENRTLAGPGASFKSRPGKYLTINAHDFALHIASIHRDGLLLTPYY